MTDSITDKLLMMELEHDFKKSKAKIDSILLKLNASIISPISYLGPKDLKFFAKSKTNNRVLEFVLTYTTGPYREALYTEFIYP